MSKPTKRDLLFSELRAAVSDYPNIQIYEQEGMHSLVFMLKGRHMRIKVTQYSGAPYLDARVHHPEEIRLLAIVVGVIGGAR